MDGHLVARFPRYAEVAKGLARAEAILAFVAAQLGSDVEVPRISLRGEPGPHFPHRFFAHELVAGVAADDSRAPASLALAADLGRALTRLHGISPDRCTRFGLASQKWDCVSSLAALVEVLARVPEVSEILPEATEWCQAAERVPDAYRGPRRLIHDDLQPEHIIVDPNTGRLSGIIDWGPALGDPAQDFSFIVAWAGWDFAREVLSAYRLPLDPDFGRRLLFLGCVRALGWLAYEAHRGLDTGRTAEVARELMSRFRSL